MDAQDLQDGNVQTVPMPSLPARRTAVTRELAVRRGRIVSEARQNLPGRIVDLAKKTKQYWGTAQQIDDANVQVELTLVSYETPLIPRSPLSLESASETLEGDVVVVVPPPSHPAQFLPSLLHLIWREVLLVLQADASAKF